MANQHDLIKRLSSLLYHSKGWIKFLDIISIITVLGGPKHSGFNSGLATYLDWRAVTANSHGLEQACNTGDEAALISCASFGFIASTSQLY